MKRIGVCFVAVCALAATSAVGVAPAKNGKGTMCVLHAKLRAQPAGTTSTAKGHTQVKVRQNGTITFKTKILNKGHETFVAGHVHKAPVGVSGPLVVSLFNGPPTSALHIKQRGAVTAEPGTTGADLCQDPSAYYVNYHTTGFPAGAIRGQLH